MILTTLWLGKLHTDTQTHTLSLKHGLFEFTLKHLLPRNFLWVWNRHSFYIFDSWCRKEADFTFQTLNLSKLIVVQHATLHVFPEQKTKDVCSQTIFRVSEDTVILVEDESCLHVWLRPGHRTRVLAPCRCLVLCDVRNAFGEGQFAAAEWKRKGRRGRMAYPLCVKAKQHSLCETRITHKDKIFLCLLHFSGSNHGRADSQCVFILFHSQLDYLFNPPELHTYHVYCLLFFADRRYIAIYSLSSVHCVQLQELPFFSFTYCCWSICKMQERQ